jgi:predicted aspartyl protease
LGLTRFQEEEVAIATGTAKVRSFESVKLKIGERSTMVDVMELPEGAEPLLGAVPKHRLGIALDLAGEAIQFLKVSKGRGYLRI